MINVSKQSPKYTLTKHRKKFILSFGLVALMIFTLTFTSLYGHLREISASLVAKCTIVFISWVDQVFLCL